MFIYIFRKAEEKMNYYYDLILNWSEDTAFYFYEWNDTDSLELIKKIPIFKVKHKTFLDLIQNKVKIDEDTMLLIKDKTILGTQSLVTKIEYASLFTDGKNVIAIEFNKEGESAFYSNLLIDDELNVLEICYNLKEYTCFYEILAKKDNNHLLRQEKEAKDLITLEIKNLYQTKNYLIQLLHL